MKRYLITFLLVTSLCGCPARNQETAPHTKNGGSDVEEGTLVEQYNDLALSWDRYELLKEIFVADDAQSSGFFIDIPKRRPEGLDRNYKFNTDWHKPGDASITNWYLIELTFAMRYFVERNAPIDENVCLDLITEYPCTLPSLIDYLIHFEAQLSPTAKNRLRSLDYRNEDLYFQGSLAYLRTKLFETDLRENSRLLKKAFQATRSRRYWETNYEMLLLRITDLVKETRSTFLLSALVEMVDKVNAHWTEALSYSLADIALDDLEFLLDNTDRDKGLLQLVGFGLHDSGQLDRFKQTYKAKIEDSDYRFHTELKILLEGFE